MDATGHYRQLAQLGRAAFLAAAAPAALVRPRGSGSSDFDGLAATGTYDQPTERRKAGAEDYPDAALDAGADVEVLPLIKKPGAPFGDRVTVGRTSNNDVVIAHHTVSRLHLYFRHRDGRWWVTDAGSKNGTALGRGDLVARRETALGDGDPLWIGDIAVVFHTAASLYTVLGGR
jgi:hypothetical protein